MTNRKQSAQAYVRKLLGIGLAAALAGTASVLADPPAEAKFEYDDAGRLKSGLYSDGKIVVYGLDAAGNRTTVATADTAAPPATLTVPVISTGSYEVSWTGSATPGVNSYKLWESPSSTYSGEVPVYSGPSPASFTGKPDGIYYYRVQACVNQICGWFRAGSNPISVGTPPGPPQSISYPATNATGSYTVSWTAPSTGTTTRYELYESSSATFSPQTQIPLSPGTQIALSGRGSGTYYYRVRACNGLICGDFRTGPAILVSPPIPSSFNVPTSSGSPLALSWGTSAGPITGYQVSQSPNASFSPDTIVYDSASASTSLARANGVYYFRVRACNGVTNCSGWRTGSNPATVVVSPASLTVPASTTNGSYSLSWAPAGGTFDYYQIYRAYNSSFTDEVFWWQGTETNRAFSGDHNGTFYFRIRVCIGAICSTPRAGSNPLDSYYPPGEPPMSIQEVPTYATNASYTMGWGTAGVGGEFFQLFQANNPSFSGETKVYEGSERQANLSYQTEGNFYYRVRACKVWPTNCGPFRTRSNYVSYWLAALAPETFNVPATSNGTHTLSWSTPTNHFDGFEIQESLSPAFDNSTIHYPGTSLSLQLPGRATGTYYYRIRSSWQGQWGTFKPGANPTVVNTPPAIPGVPTGFSISPATGTSINFTVSWVAPTSGAPVHHYTLRELVDFVQVPDITLTTTSKSYSKPGGGQFAYQVRACATSGESACSSFTNQRFKVICLPPSCGQ